MERHCRPKKTDDHARDHSDEQPSAPDSVDNGHADEEEDGVAARRNESSRRRILETEQTKDGAGVVKQSVVAGELAECLYARNRDDGTAVGLLRPVHGDALLERELALELGGRPDVLLDDLKLELDHVVGRAAVDDLEGLLGLVSLVAQDEDSGRLGKPVHQAQLDNGRDDAERDWRASARRAPRFGLHLQSTRQAMCGATPAWNPAPRALATVCPKGMKKALVPMHLPRTAVGASSAMLQE